MKTEFLENGFAKLDTLIPYTEVEKIRDLYDWLLNDRKRTQGLRSDLAGNTTDTKNIEKITQIMRPSMVEPKLAESITYTLALDHAKDLMGDDIELDFDMLINKAPHTDTPTPWHQDAAYWIKMTDKRAASCWIALDDVYEDNGCMWFIPKEEDSIRPHVQTAGGGALQCEADMSLAQSIPLKSGGCTFHDGYTLHFSKGNTTNSQRRALILNFRPKSMIELERSQGFDHTNKREVRNK